MMRSFTAATAAASLLSVASGTFNAASKNNVAVYWGQGAYQERLSTFCQDTDADIINLAFINGFPDHSPGGWPASNFGNACGDLFYNNGVQTGLRSHCPTIGPDIKTCQQAGKKVFLSLGGGYPTDYYIRNSTTAKDFAEFLWGAFGPLTTRWAEEGLPRPFGDAVVDGFDYDIESDLPNDRDGEHRGYADMINYFHDYLYPLGGKPFYTSIAPQCIVPDVHLADALANSWVDFVFVQFYNTDLCSARTALTQPEKFTYDAWKNAPTLNPNAKIYIGLPASTEAIFTDDSNYLDPNEANTLTRRYYSDSRFGGIMLWEATYSRNNEICEKPFVYHMKQMLLEQASGKDYIVDANDCPIPPANETIISPDGTCGLQLNGNTHICPDEECCGADNTCGTSDDVCSLELGCQPDFGTCAEPGPVTIESPDGTCGPQLNGNTYICPGEECCGADNTCGASDDVCSLDLGCQEDFGTCKNITAPGTIESPDGTCGPQLDGNTYICPGEECCGADNTCGTSDDVCSLELGCQEDFGTCAAPTTGNSSSSSSSSSTSSSSSSSTSSSSSSSTSSSLSASSGASGSGSASSSPTSFLPTATPSSSSSLPASNGASGSGSASSSPTSFLPTATPSSSSSLPASNGASGSGSASSLPTSFLPTATRSSSSAQLSPTSPPASFTSTVYSTLTHTITDCPDTVPDCPSHQKTTRTVTTVVAITTTVCPVTDEPEPTNKPEPQPSNNPVPPPPASSGAVPEPIVTLTVVPQPPTTLIPVRSSSVVPPPAESPVAPPAGSSPVVPPPASSRVAPPAGSSPVVPPPVVQSSVPATPSTSAPVQFEGGAATIGVSGLVGAVAIVMALL